MRLKTKSPQDLWCGIFFVALGVLAMYLAHDYQMGTALHMGPGYFPMWLGAILVVFGIALTLLSLRVESEDGESLAWRTWAFRPWLVLPAALVAFGLMMEAQAGFIPSLLVLVIGTALAHRDIHWGETIVLSIFVAAGAVAIFSYGLELPYPLFWWSYW